MAFRSATTATSGAGTTTSIAVPAGVAVGDIVVLLESDDGPNGSITWPSGFTQLDKRFISTDGQNIGIAWKRLNAVDSGTYTVTHPNTGLANSAALLCLAFSGRDGTAEPVLTVGSQASGTGTVTVSATLTAVSGDDLMFAIMTDPTTSGTATFTPPSGFTDEADVNGTSLSHAEAGTEDGVSAGSITASGSVASSASKSVVPYFLRIPAAAGSGGTQQPVSGTVGATANTVLAVASIRATSATSSASSSTGLTAAALLAAAGTAAAVTAASLSAGLLGAVAPQPADAVSGASLSASSMQAISGTSTATSSTGLTVGVISAADKQVSGTAAVTSAVSLGASLIASIDGSAPVTSAVSLTASGLYRAAGRADATSGSSGTTMATLVVEPLAVAAVSGASLTVTNPGAARDLTIGAPVEHRSRTISQIVEYPTRIIGAVLEHPTRSSGTVIDRS